MIVKLVVNEINQNTPNSFHPLSGRGDCKVLASTASGGYLGVSIPFRGEVIVKYSLLHLNKKENLFCFHPLSGRGDCKEFTFGNLARRGFETPQSTPLF
ncbi:hypothetical protein FDUTEX481_09141 [Tolypothrix sp. PCC 7601]|nr:hypothetical protein FDUTEX481_09141 [Tolypothrix sp. PCC 7601]